MSTTIASKRPRLDMSMADTFTDTPAQGVAVAAIRRIMEKFSVDPTMLEKDNSEDDLGACFSNVTYEQVAPLIGLKPYNDMRDIATFDIHRSRIPTNLFKSIVTDINIMMLQYGPPYEHETGEATSRFFSPIFNHLVKQFNFTLRNNPETMAKSRIFTQGCIGQIKVIDAVAILFIEMKLELRNTAERLKAIARVIAESNYRDLKNPRGFSLPIHCVFSDGWSFEFFKFERKPNPSFKRGCFPGDPKPLQRGLIIPDFTGMGTSLPFILELRTICEAIFDLMLSAYLEGLKAYRRRSEKRGKKKKRRRPSLDIWDRPVQSAECALATFRRAEDQRKDGDIALANATVDQALLVLKESTGAVSTRRKYDIMKDWDDDEVEKT